MANELTLADVLPPDVLNSARTLAVDTLNLVSTNDGIAKDTTVSDDEDGVLVATLLLTGTLDTTAEGLHATIIGTLDVVRFLKGLAALGSGNGECGALVQLVELLVRRGIVRAGQSRGEEEGNEEKFLVHSGMRGMVDSGEKFDLVIALLVWKTVRRVMMKNLYFFQGYTNPRIGCSHMSDQFNGLGMSCFNLLHTVWLKNRV